MMAPRKTKFTIKLQPNNKLTYLSALSWGMDDEPPVQEILVVPINMLFGIMVSGNVATATIS